MTVKLFQDVAGTIPAILAGQPVGFIKRIRGSDDAKQATALSKPTYARWPRSGKRNLADGAQSPASSLFWRQTTSSAGLTCEKIGTGIEDGQPYVDLRLYGTTTAVAFIGLNSPNLNVVASEVSAVVTARLLSGEMIDVGLSGFRVQAQRKNLEGVLIEAAPTSPTVQATEDTTITYRADQGTSGGVVMGLVVQLRMAEGVTVDQVWRVKGLMYVVGPTLGQFQYNYGPNDITEPGVADLWHLYNDGGDSLNVVLPAGTYGLASIGIDRQIIVTTFISDGTTPVNILRHERQLNVSYRLGAYSAAEELAIRDHWGRKYA